MARVITILILVVMTMIPAAAQTPWRDFAASLPVGSTVNVRLTDGRRFTATLIAVQRDALLLQPKTRQPVPVQPLPYADIAALERAKTGGLSTGKAIAIGAATGGGVFLGLLLAMVSALD